MMREQCPAGTKVWFRDGAFLRAGVVVIVSGPQVCIRAGMQLVLRVRKDVWANEVDAVRYQLQEISQQAGILDTAKANGLARLSQLAAAAPRVVATVHHSDGRIQHLCACECPECMARQCRS